MCMYVTTKPESAYWWIISRWNRIQSYARFLTYSWIAMSAKFPFVLTSPIVPGIIDLSKFSYDNLEEIVEGGQGSFGVYW